MYLAIRSSRLNFSSTSFLGFIWRTSFYSSSLFPHKARIVRTILRRLQFENAFLRFSSFLYNFSLNNSILCTKALSFIFLFKITSGSSQSLNFSFCCFGKSRRSSHLLSRPYWSIYFAGLGILYSFVPSGSPLRMVATKFIAFLRISSSFGSW